MRRRAQGFLTFLAVMLVAAVAVPAGAEVFPVPDSVRQLRAPHEEVHVLRALDGGVPLGEQRSVATVADDTLVLEVTTRFTSGEQWQEHVELDLRNGYRARAFRKQAWLRGELIAEQALDFKSGEASWLHEGVRSTRVLGLTADTYIGPMLGIVLADVPERATGTGSFQDVVFSPDPRIYTLRADVVDRETLSVGNVAEPATKVRLKADLGPVQNVVFASLIPTHYFWFTREGTPEFLAFEGSLGYHGPELRMLPVRPAERTAQAGERTTTTR